MIIKSGEKFEEIPIFCFKNDKNLANFDLSTKKSKKFVKYITFDLKKYRGVIFHDNEESCKIWRKIDLWFRKWHEEFSKVFSEPLKVSKLVH